MSYGRKWKPSRSAAAEFKNKMSEIDSFCNEHGIIQSRSSDSYYFTISGISYRVSNHSVESSNAHAYNAAGEQIRENIMLEAVKQIQYTSMQARPGL